MTFKLFRILCLLLASASILMPLEEAVWAFGWGLGFLYLTEQDNDR